MCVVAVAVGEVGTQRTVNEAARQDGLLRSASFTAEERAGDLADGVHTLFDVHGQGEEVGARAQPRRCGCGDEDFGVSNAHRNGAVGELG